MKKAKEILATTVLSGALVLQGTVEAQQNSQTDEKSTESIRPFKIHFPDKDLTALRQRIRATIWPEKETVSDVSQGVQLKTIQQLAKYWATDYDWRKAETTLNSYPNFITNIDGLDIHFIHVKSKHQNALPMIVTHGWPGSIIELLKIIKPLADPTSYGGKAEDAFDIVIPSIPGYAFSEKPAGTGWDPSRIANAWITLMNRLGYKRYVAQGGDWGDAITEQMAIMAPRELIGIHTNLPAAVPMEILQALGSHQPAPATLSADERKAYDQIAYFLERGLGYAMEMKNRPQTLYGIADSPIGLAAWIPDHDIRSYELIARVFDEGKEGLTKDDILDNITLYWLTSTAISSARIYWENKFPFFVPRGVKIPVAVSAFPDEIYQAPKSWVVQSFPNLTYYNRLPKGGHFAAWEQPELFCQEMRASFKPLR